MKPLLLLCFLLVVAANLFGQDIPPEITRRQYELPSTGNQVWVYHPTILPAESVPCVLVAGAGTRMFHGIKLADGDVAEHLDYVRAGFVVIAYGLSGPWPDQISDAAVTESILEFIQSGGGVNDAVAALTFAKEKHSFIDGDRLYAAGHSSAAVVALNLVQRSERFRGCIAYAPPADLERRFGEQAIADMDADFSGFRKFIMETSPFRNAALIKCPVFIFNAKDDSNVPASMVTDYVAALRQAGKKVKHLEIATGDHYDSMIMEGIPAGIKWIQKMESSPEEFLADPAVAAPEELTYAEIEEFAREITDVVWEMRGTSQLKRLRFDGAEMWALSPEGVPVASYDFAFVDSRCFVLNFKSGGQAWHFFDEDLDWITPIRTSTAVVFTPFESPPKPVRSFPDDIKDVVWVSDSADGISVKFRWNGEYLQVGQKVDGEWRTENHPYLSAGLRRMEVHDNKGNRLWLAFTEDGTECFFLGVTDVFGGHRSDSKPVADRSAGEERLTPQHNDLANHAEDLFNAGEKEMAATLFREFEQKLPRYRNGYEQQLAELTVRLGQ